MKRKLASILIAGLMIISLATTAIAADITIEGQGNQYQAYRLMNLTTSLKTDIDHSAGDHVHTSACYNYAYTVNGTYRSALQAAMPTTDDDGDGFKNWDANKDGVASDDEILTYLGGLADDGDDIRVFADAVYAQVKSMTADATAADKTFADVPQGYYLIVETTPAADPDSRSLVMLDTAGQENITVQSKEGVPVLTKQVYEENKSTGAGAWQDAADAFINDNVKFKLVGSFPKNITNYSSYKYIIHDSLDTTLTLDESSIEVSMGGKALVKDTDYTVETSGLESGCSFEIRISDAVAVANRYAEIILSDSTVVAVEYSAKLGTDSKVGNPGNSNVAHLEFSSDPYDVNTTSNTTSDKVNVFTYQMTVNKVDTSNNPLVGAGFKLQRFDNATGSYVDYDTTSGAKEDGKTSFVFKGLDSGKYKLVETDVPAGYKNADDIEFVVEATYPANSDDAALTALVIKNADGIIISKGEDATFSTAYNTGLISTNIVNSTGIHLPSTGGAGAYLVYGIGIVAVIIGAIILIPKKKKQDEDIAG